MERAKAHVSPQRIVPFTVVQLWFDFSRAAQFAKSFWCCGVVESPQRQHLVSALSRSRPLTFLLDPAVYHTETILAPKSLFTNKGPFSLVNMARNSEKAQSMLFRFRAAQAAESGLLPTGSLRRPKAPSTVSTIPLCEKWRGQILKEVSRKVTKIQDESLSDFQIRDLNDEINKLMKEKWGWERRIRELGGPNYMRGGGTVFDDQGREVPGGGKGYRYFGRARELPGVKEMFERAAKRRVHGDEDQDKPKPGPDINRKNLDANYFGFGLDEEDGTLLRYEREKEKEAVKKVALLGESDEGDPDWEPLPGDAGDGVPWKLPTLIEVQEELVDRRRRQLLDNLG